LLSRLDRWLAPAPDPARVAWLREHAYAHRGKHGDGLIENSLAAFEAAIAAGLGIECDVQRTADGAALVFHDCELDRLTASTARCAAHAPRLPADPLARPASRSRCSRPARQVAGACRC
jgi:glycerophosphoryl diester phosphodiesterase